MNQWWADRQPRERMLLASVGVLVFVFAVFQFLIMPLADYRASAQDQHDAALAMLQEVEAGARTVQTLQAAAGERPEGAARTVVATTATELALAITRLQPLESGELDVWLDDVASPLLYAWIGRLQERGIPVTRAVIQKNDRATVSAQITFAGGAAP
jgi:general secretion pathway protein M